MNTESHVYIHIILLHYLRCYFCIVAIIIIIIIIIIKNNSIVRRLSGPR